MPGTLNWLLSFGLVSGLPSGPTTGVLEPSGLMTYIVSPTAVTLPAGSFGIWTVVPVLGSRNSTAGLPDLVASLPSASILSSCAVAVGVFGSWGTSPTGPACAQLRFARLPV